MPFSAAVQDLPHCGRGQRGIDFFFKTSSKSALSSAAAQEKRDILAYFKKVEVTKEQEEQNYMSSLSNNTADTDCSVFSSEEEEIKPGKNGKISRKESVRDFSDNTNANIGTKKSEVVNNRPKKIVVDAIDLTKETEPSENRVKGQNVKACDSSGKSQRSSEAIGNSDDSENIRVKGQNVKACDSTGKSQRSSEAIGNSDDTEDEKTSPVIDVDLISDCEEETVKNTTGSNGCTVESRDCMETESIEATKGKGDVSNTLPSNNVTETKRNVFTLLMSNRGRKSEAGKQSAEDTKPLHEAGEGNGRSQKSDDCVVVSSSPSSNCEAAKGIVDVNPDASKNSHEADVHAPLDGNKKAERKPGSPVHTQASGESDVTSTTTNGAAPTADSTKKNTKRTKKNMRNNCNLDELNKIELLEQIPPSKPLSKKVLNKVCVEEKVCDVEEIRHPVKAEVCKAVKADDKVTVASKKGQIINRRSLSRRKINLKATRCAGKKFLRRRKAQVISSDEESADEIFLRKKNKPVESDNDVMVTSSSSSISTVSSEDGGEGKAPSARQSSPEASEDDKENVAHYTSQLVRQPGKLSLRIRRVHPPKETSGKVKLKPSKANKNTGTLKKLKGAKSMLKKRKLRNSPKHKSRKGEADRDSADADGTPPAEQEVTTLDDETDDSSGKQTSKKKTRRAKVKQTLLKPLMPKASTRGRLGKKDAGVSRGESGGEEQGGTQRRTLRRAAAAAKKYIEEATIDDDDDKPKKADKNPKKLVSNKGMKLAPIFCKRATSPGVELLRVVPLSPSKLKARQDFLTSSVSEDIRKQLAVEKSGEDESLAWPPFPAVSHVQQREEGEGGAPWNLEDPEIPLKETPSFSPSLESLAFTLDQKGITTTKALHSKPSYHVPRLELGDIVLSLSCMKSKYPDFPVYEVFKAYYDLKKEAVETYHKEVQKEQTVVHLDDDDDDDDVGRSGKRRKRKRKNKLSSLSRGKRRKLGSVKETVEEPPQNQVEEVPSVWHERTPHIWTQTFMPQNAKQVIGNTDDFMVSDDSSLGSEGVDFTSTYLLCGPPGAGKTAAVYALASELGYKVLEVNASSRRPGRQVMSQLAEATQSHSVSNASAAAQPSGAFSALFAAKTSSNASKKENSQTGDTSKHDRDSNKMKGVSLVLFEDIDIVFEEWDEGFMSTVNTLMATTKRPIILTATHASPAILAQVKESFEVMEFVLPQQKLTAQHLQLVALANGCHVCLQDAEWLVHHNKGDVRKSMLDLQLLSQSGSSHDLCDCAVSKQPEHKVKPSDPPHVQKASQCCLKSLATMYDSLAHLDILSSSQIRTHEAEIKDIGWWVKQPTAGLSDTPSLSHPYWTPHSNGDIIEELAENAVTCCVGEVVSALEGVTAKDWPQLCLPRHRRGDSHDCIVHSCNYESERVEKRNVMSRLFDNLPAVGVVSRGAGLDYLPALRSLAREDELGAALGRGRRGRRFLSHFLQMGWSVAPEERISLANSLIT
ncbi:ATPase family AAA domain-containing protein 5 [Chionoecetes opilio]|uniref:ATPase family AAA domain-containing protein 5 n=1 Tax=Chionoecetes opilio TaxID=41210 RepID=A0A8J4Y954_CHIOP|nr:ATPase family AAA domain-containing protein 5 [Chionoecetes opilio]